MPFVTFEGIDGCGKTLQARMLKDYLEEKGFDVLLTKEPGGFVDLKYILMKGDLFPISELFLFLADRVEHVEREIKPFLKKGGWVISDRFHDSTLAYQGFGLGIDLELVMELNKMACCGIEPDITFLIDVPIRVAMRRMRERGKLSGIERRGFDFQERVRRGYLEIYKRFFDRVVLINGLLSPEEIHRKILEALSRRFSGLF